MKFTMTKHLAKLIHNADLAERRLADLSVKLREIRKFYINKKIEELSVENEELTEKVEKAKKQLVSLEILNGKKQYSIPGKINTHCSSKSEIVNVQTEKKLNANEKKEKKPKEKLVAKSVEDSPVDIRKLDFRIGKIVDINKHPDADSLYVEKIDCGENNPRTVVSGLVNHVPIDEMRERLVMVLCNLKPVKMRGVTSEAMVMCASSPEKVEVLVPPINAVPGDVVTCQGYPREPEPLLNPKKKIFETCAPDLKTNNENVACYKESPLVVEGKGPILAPSLKNVHVK